MNFLLQQIVNGLVTGSIYALVALGYTMVYGILGLINFAHGEVVMIGALTSISVIHVLAGSGLPPGLVVLIGLLAAVPVCMAVAFTMERVAYRPLRHAPRLAPLITAIGVSIVLQQIAMLIWGRQFHPFPLNLPVERHTLAGATFTDLHLIIVVLALVIMAGLMAMVNFTRLGRAMRATAENPAIAALMGVNVDKIIASTFLIGAGLAAVAGVMVSANYSIAHYNMGFMLGLKAFTAAVLGGIGNLAGAMVGGVMLGIIEALGAGYIGQLTGGVFGSDYKDVFAFFVLILVLIFRPSGIMGEKVAERA